jgi:hypothetical protein
MQFHHNYPANRQPFLHGILTNPTSLPCLSPQVTWKRTIAQGCLLRSPSAELRADRAELQRESTKSQLEEGARRLIALGMPIAQIAEILNMAIEDLCDLK